MTCPLCKKPSEQAFKPFCSARCRDHDLHKWFTGTYAVPAVELDDVDAEALEQAAGPEETPES